MRHAYLIMAHTQPELLKKILKSLDNEDNDFIIHLDAKSPLMPSDFEDCIKKGRIYFTDRISVSWGHDSIIRAEFILLKKALAVGDHDYYHLLSGQDFPLKSPDEINRFFAENAGKEFVHFCTDEFTEKSYTRRILVKHYLLEKWGRTKNMWFFAYYFLTGVQKFFFKLFKPKWSPDKFLMGSQFFSITQELATELVKAEQDILKRYKHSFCCDEVFVQTFVYNSKFRDNLYVKGRNSDIHGNMRYIDWSRTVNGSPSTITEADVPAALESGLLFARKVDMNSCPDAVKLLEEALNANSK